MLLVSNHLLLTTPIVFPAETVVVRINIAWVRDKKELARLLRTTPHDIYLDYPQGRTKPPVPRLSLEDAIVFAHTFPNVKYFAVSNVEDPENIYAIKSRLPAHIEVVPKIETAVGIRNLERIVKKIRAKYVMLDKEDLYLDIDRNPKRFDTLVQSARKKALRSGTTLLELHGVVFLPHKKATSKDHTPASSWVDSTLPAR